MNSDTVNPMPATVATTATLTQRTPSGRRARRMRTASQANNVMPIGLPTTRPRNTPRNTGAVTSNDSLDSGIPALASANTGTMT